MSWAGKRVSVTVAMKRRAMVGISTMAMLEEVGILVTVTRVVVGISEEEMILEEAGSLVVEMILEEVEALVVEMISEEAGVLAMMIVEAEISKAWTEHCCRVRVAKRPPALVLYIWPQV
jgi:hypothetical protein